MFGIYPSLGDNDIILFLYENEEYFCELDRLYNNIGITVDKPKLIKVKDFSDYKKRDQEILSYCTSKKIHGDFIFELSKKMYNKHFIHKVLINNNINTLEKEMVYTREELIKKSEIIFKAKGGFLKKKWNGIVLKNPEDEAGLGNYFIKSIFNLYSILNNKTFDVDGNDLLTLRKNIANGLLLEPWLPDEYKFYNFQFYIKDENNFEFLGSSEQLMCSIKHDLLERKIFKGNKNIDDEELNNRLLKISRPLIYHLMKMNYTGIVGVDLYSNRRDSGVVEVNCRFNTATSFYFLVRRKKISMPKKWRLCEYPLNKEYSIRHIVDKLLSIHRIYRKESKEYALPTIITKKALQFVISGRSNEEINLIEEEVANLEIIEKYS